MNPAPPDLAPAVFRIATDDRFIASLYWIWSGGKLDLKAIATELGASVDSVITAGLCFRPRSDDAFLIDVTKIADYSGINRDTLVSFVRAAESLIAFKQTSEHDHFLAAARDLGRDQGDD